MVYLKHLLLLFVLFSTSIASTAFLGICESFIVIPEKKKQTKKKPPIVDRMQSCIDWIGTSGMTNFFAKDLRRGMLIPEERVSQELEKKWDNAQKKARIPVYYRIPIRYGKQKSNELFAVYPEYLHSIIKDSTERSYGMVHHYLNHEAQHVKYNDGIMTQLFPVLISIGCYYSLLSIPELFYAEKIKPSFDIRNISSKFLISCLVGSFFQYTCAQKKYERRADIQGAYATQCYVCISEVAQGWKKTKKKTLTKIALIDKSSQPISFEQQIQKKKYKAYLQRHAGGNSPYLSSKEFMHIAWDLRKQGLVCSYHKKRRIA